MPRDQHTYTATIPGFSHELFRVRAYASTENRPRLYGVISRAGLRERMQSNKAPRSFRVRLAADHAAHIDRFANLKEARAAAAARNEAASEADLAEAEQLAEYGVQIEVDPARRTYVVVKLTMLSKPGTGNVSTAVLP
jgi:hypothetical protein